MGYGVEDESHKNCMQAIFTEINRDGHGHERGRVEDVGSRGPFDSLLVVPELLPSEKNASEIEDKWPTMCLTSVNPHQKNALVTTR